MPDVHWGYGFPIGGVAATDVDRGGVVSPGGVGFDISCGVRLLVSELHASEIGHRLTALMDELDRRIPQGMGPGCIWQLRDGRELTRLLTAGSRYAVERGQGNDRDLDHCEDQGFVADADPAAVSDRARRRGSVQVGSLGSGNHFLEVQVVDTVYDEAAASGFGLSAGAVCVMVRCGSRGLGRQICSDHVKAMLERMPRYGVEVPDPQLACVPVRSPEGEAYLGAMAAAANYGRANRQLPCVATRAAFASAVGTGRLDLLYDVSHNLAKLERHLVGDERTRTAAWPRRPPSPTRTSTRSSRPANEPVWPGGSPGSGPSGSSKAESSRPAPATQPSSSERNTTAVSAQCSKVAIAGPGNEVHRLQGDAQRVGLMPE